MITILTRKANLRKALRSTLAGIIALVVILSGCGGTAGDGSNQTRIVTTTSIWGDVVGGVAGDDASVTVLIPVGADAHDYQATSRQVASLQEADLVIVNGLGLEEGLADVLESATTDGANILEVGPELNPLPLEDHQHEEAESGEDQRGVLDPHIWFDPVRVATAAQLIATRLADIDDSVDWEARAAEYSETLHQADREITRLLESVPDENRKLVTNHEALGYFARRYGFEVVAVVIPGGSTLGEPSSAEMARLVEVIEHEGVDTIFAETTQPTRLAEAVAAEVGSHVAVVELYTESLGEPGTDADTLPGMLMTNARLIADALTRN